MKGKRPAKFVSRERYIRAEYRQKPLAAAAAGGRLDDQYVVGLRIRVSFFAGPGGDDSNWLADSTIRST
jgi:hypothetical protein